MRDSKLFILTTDPLNRNEFEDCCRPRPGRQPSKYCFNIDVAPHDEFFSRFGVRCIDFVRGFPGVRHGCRLGMLYYRLINQNYWSRPFYVGMTRRIFKERWDKNEFTGTVLPALPTFQFLPSGCSLDFLTLFLFKMAFSVPTWRPQ